MRTLPTLLIALATLASAGCNTSGPSDGDSDGNIVIESPTLPVAPGSTLALALANRTERTVHAGALPCTVTVERRINGKWEPTGAGEPICPAIAIIIDAGTRHEFTTQAPGSLGTYRFVTSVSEGNAGSLRIYSQPLSVVVFAY